MEDRAIRLLDGIESIYALALSALDSGIGLAKAAADRAGGEVLDYDEIYAGAGPWHVLPAIDHPVESSRCQISGTGLSHLRSAANRDAMHAAGTVTDSMRMYQWGVEGGRPAAGMPGVSPEWFYKGTGGNLRAHNQPLDVPPYAEDGGEEPEIAGIYIIDAQGAPRRIGMAAGNEFSDHVFEKKNYLYLASSKLRTCALGPELAIDPDFSLVRGEVAIERGRRNHLAEGDSDRANPRCATAWPIWNTTTSSSKRTGGREICTCTSSAPTRSASAKGSGWPTAM